MIIIIIIDEEVYVIVAEYFRSDLQNLLSYH